MSEKPEKNAPLKTFPTPEKVLKDPKAVAILSAWIAEGQLQLAAQRTFERPEMWGQFLMDLAKHASMMYAQQGVMSQPEAMTRILGVLSRHTGGHMDSGQTTIL
ncbi:MAG: DUF5076 domain-containing protein [Caulobacteraceae bacterium]|nr:DUF5076 domain-containing protein [Caulobacteraceae bacterium]